MNDHCTAVVAASGDLGAGTPFHEFSGHFINATLLQETRSFTTLTDEKVIDNRDEIMSQH